MIDPFNITDFNRSDRDLQEFLLFAVCVAGKTATTIARRVALLIERAEKTRPPGMLPMGCLTGRRKARLIKLLKRCGIGDYTTKARCIVKLAREVTDGRLDLRTCTTDNLERYPGIGPKTARFFLMHSRPNQRVAAIDTHILKYLASKDIKCPKSTPPKGNTYSRLEQAFLRLADEAGETPADHDLKIWRWYATDKKANPNDQR